VGVDRRSALKVLGGIAGAGLAGRFLLLPPSRSRELSSARELAVRIYEALDGEERERACVAYDHPFRQYHNRGVWGGGLQINPFSLGFRERGIATDLLHAGLSEAGRERVPREYYSRWMGVHGMKLLICGDPRTPPYQLILTGGHLNLRIGGESREGVAFGGPQVYGDQRGDGRPGLPGNLYQFQFQIARRLFDSLRPEEQRRAVLKTAPIQTAIELRGREGRFDGVPISGLSKESRTIARELIAAIFSTYPDEDVAYAQRCIEENGGAEALFLSYYEEADDGGNEELQIFRLEGPAAVLFFRGYPHVHAFINVAMNGDLPLSVGELLGENPRELDRPSVQALFERALEEQTGADLAFYELDSVVGTLRRGPIRTGDVYTLESWQNALAVLEIKGSSLNAAFVDELKKRGLDPDPTTPRIARASSSATRPRGQHAGWCATR
jgi:hypothetical protein